MENLLYIIAILLLIGWGIGFLGFYAGGAIHILLVLALAVFIVKVSGVKYWKPSRR